jgi:hypothetical protein
MILAWIAVWGIIELAIEALVPATATRRILTYGALLCLAVIGEIVFSRSGEAGL